MSDTRMPEPPLPDARPLNWVDRHAPEGLKPWLKLGRFDRPIGIWLLMLPGWQGVALAFAERGTPIDWRAFAVLMVKFAIGATLMRAAGCAYNDIVDRDIDAKVARTADRPLASGRIKVKQAWAFVVGCALISLVVLLSFSPPAVLLGIGSLALVAIYPFMKRITWWPQAWLGLTFNWGALLGYAAAQGGASSLWWLSAQLTGAGAGAATPQVSAPGGFLSLSAVLLYASGFFWTLGYDTIYALQDIEDDAMVGVKSTARRLGRHVPVAVLVFYGLTTFLALSLWLPSGLGVMYFPFLALFALHLASQVRRLKLDDPALALRLFKSNQIAGLVLFAGLVAGSWR
jgi:4-hydroxybenzoate polyprenyltransferase